MSYDALDRLHRQLVEAVKRAAPEPIDRQLTIADVYQHLVPYRAVRGELGFTELKEYEHTLLRLFAGEREYVEVQVRQVADEFTRELRSPNPILGIYRDYAAVGVSLNTRSTAPVVEAAPPAPAAEPLPVVPAPAPVPIVAAAEPARDDVTADHEPVPTDHRQSPPPVAVITEDPRPARRADCWSCQEPLPMDREVRFCPHCGTVQVPTPCGECGEPIDADWKFCVFCGSSRAQLTEMPGS